MTGSLWRVFSGVASERLDRFHPGEERPQVRDRLTDFASDSTSSAFRRFSRMLGRNASTLRGLPLELVLLADSFGVGVIALSFAIHVLVPL